MMKFLSVFLPIIFSVILLAALILILWLCLLGSIRKGHLKGKHFRTVLYAHRGLHDEEKPENSLAAFAAAVEQGYGIELDIHLTSDGELLVMHDATLLRTCGVDLKVCETSLAELKKHPLSDGSLPPTLEEVLALVDGKSALLIELKYDGNNGKLLVARTLKALEGYEGEYCFESFDPRIVRQMRKQCSHIYRGQLANDYLRYKGNFFIKLLLTSMFYNAMGRPDFISYNYEYKDALPLRLAEKFGADIFFWTIRKEEDYLYCKQRGYGCIFENFIPK